METKKIAVLVGAGIAAAGIGYYLYTKNKSGATQTTVDESGNQTVTASVAASTPTSSGAPSTTPLIKQTMWKDKDGNVFELTSQEDKYGFVLKVNGGGQAKAVTVTLDPSGVINITNKAGEKWAFKNNGWARLSGISGLGFAMQPRGFAGNSAYLLNG